MRSVREEHRLRPGPPHPLLSLPTRDSHLSSRILVPDEPQFLNFSFLRVTAPTICNAAACVDRGWNGVRVQRIFVCQGNLTIGTEAVSTVS